MATHSSVLAWRIPGTAEPAARQAALLPAHRWAAIYGVAQSQARLKRLSSSGSSRSRIEIPD